MPLDSIFLGAVVDGLQPLIGGKVDKIFQPEKDEVIFAVRCSLGNVRLLMSAAQGSARVHITERMRENPQTPPMFCMLLRKHLVGGRIMSITQPPDERIVHFNLEVNDELGERVKKTVAAEMMGNSANIVLIDHEGRVIECVRRVEGDAKRPMLPGLFYRLPESRGFGLSPLIQRELEYQNLSLDSLEARVNHKDFTPLMLLHDDKPKDFSFMPIRQYDGIYTSETYSGFSELLDAFYSKRDAENLMRRRSAGLRKIVSNALERARRKLIIQNEEYAATLNRERLRQYGDLLMANLNNIKRGDTSAAVQDFYGEEGTVASIKLDAALSAQQNAAKYYKEYNKAKNAQEKLTGLIKKCEQDIEYLESVIDAFDKAANNPDIDDIRDELEQTGLLPKRKDKKKSHSKPSKPLVFKSDSGVMIYVGRNNRQNDELTLKTAAKDDLWLHTQKIAGSHVIIDCKGNSPDDITLEQAAILAAAYSQGRRGQKVPVDYTQVKYVKKAAGGKPGLVIYDKFKTVFVNPDEKLAERLLVK
ncbi:MAG: NFACT family protein [Oscillospiraceae bacterium]|nr:NFACT family protein [Oscillospiraceae bacterium]